MDPVGGNRDHYRYHDAEKENPYPEKRCQYAPDKPYHGIFGSGAAVGSVPKIHADDNSEGNQHNADNVLQMGYLGAVLTYHNRQENRQTTADAAGDEKYRYNPRIPYLNGADIADRKARINRLGKSEDTGDYFKRGNRAGCLRCPLHQYHRYRGKNAE